MRTRPGAWRDLGASADDGGLAQHDEPLHELEIEFRDSYELLKQAERHARQQPSTYHDMLQVFLNNIRMLIRNADTNA